MSKSALVTGASEGIGRAFAVRLAKEGYQVTAVARSEAKLKALVGELGSAHKYAVADLSETSGQDRCVQLLQKESFQLLVNNAGVGTVGAFTDVPVERQLAMFHLNCEAVVKLSHAFLAGAKPQDALINVSSTLAFTPMAGLGLYCATKSFVTAFSETLWFEQKKRGVYVMNLCPGITETNFQVAAGGRKEDLPKNMAETPEQVVETAMRALAARDKPTVISGGKNAAFAAMSRIMPRKALVTALGKMMK